MPDAYDLVLEFSRSERAGQPHAFRFAPQTYLLRTPGGGFESAEFPWTPELLRDLADARDPGRAPDTIHRIGDTLRGFLAAAGWAHHEQAIVRAAHEGAPIVLTIRSAAAELYALPWEFVALKSTGQLLGGIPGLLVRYEWPDAPTFPDRVAAPRTGRILFAWSAAGGAVPAEGHLAALRDAMAAHPGAFDPERDVLAHATFGRIGQALADAAAHGPPIDAVHLLCHGAGVGGSYGLALDDESSPGAPVVVDAGRMQQLLAAHAGMVRMVVLAACDSANSGELGNHLGSVAQMIHRAGVQAMIASRFPLSAAGSTRFAAALFGALARGSTLEAGFIAARDALLRDPSQLDWASVQLYSRPADGDATYPLAIGARPRPAPVPPASPHAPVLAPADPRHDSRPRIVVVPAATPWLAILGAAGGLLTLAFLTCLLIPQDWIDDSDDPTDTAPVAAPPADTKPPDPKPPDAKPPDPAPTDAKTPDLAPPPITPKNTNTGTKRSTAKDSEPTPGPDAPAANRTPGRCPAAVTAYLGNFIEDDPDGDPVELTILVSAEGKLAITTDRPLAADETTAPLLRANASNLITRGAGQLPCKLSLAWRP